ncbi:hypothetical protein BTVI_140589 [Pitangus sulphuratus]|nr:hypothetical protein BTVI_140589 [Pitangus sulphuratus]
MFRYENNAESDLENPVFILIAGEEIRGHQSVSGDPWQQILSLDWAGISWKKKPKPNPGLNWRWKKSSAESLDNVQKENSPLPKEKGGAECTISEFADDIEWAVLKDKRPCSSKYKLEEGWLESSPAEGDLGVLAGSSIGARSSQEDKPHLVKRAGPVHHRVTSGLKGQKADLLTYGRKAGLQTLAPGSKNEAAGQEREKMTEPGGVVALASMFVFVLEEQSFWALSIKFWSVSQERQWSLCNVGCFICKIYSSPISLMGKNYLSCDPGVSESTIPVVFPGLKDINEEVTKDGSE